jgi:hypothetical protein
MLVPEHKPNTKEADRVRQASLERVEDNRDKIYLQLSPARS